MNDEHKRVVELIRTAFSGVVLEDGIGLWEAQGIDDYQSKERQAEYRSKDEKEDWSKITGEDMTYCYSSLSFFDAKGMRFHLPAFLIGDLEGTYLNDVIFTLSYDVDDSLSRFDLLTNEQHNAVREYLLFYLANLDHDFERPMIEKALEEYWVEK